MQKRPRAEGPRDKPQAPSAVLVTKLVCTDCAFGITKKLCPRVTARGQNPEFVLQPKLIRGLCLVTYYWAKLSVIVSFSNSVSHRGGACGRGAGRACPPSFRAAPARPTAAAGDTAFHPKRSLGTRARAQIALGQEWKKRKNIP